MVYYFLGLDGAAVYKIYVVPPSIRAVLQPCGGGGRLLSCLGKKQAFPTCRRLVLFFCIDKQNDNSSCFVFKVIVSSSFTRSIFPFREVRPSCILYMQYYIDAANWTWTWNPHTFPVNIRLFFRLEKEKAAERKNLWYSLGQSVFVVQELRTFSVKIWKYWDLPGLVSNTTHILMILCYVLSYRNRNVFLLCKSSVPPSLPSDLSLSLWSSSYSTVSLLQYWEEVTVDELSPHLHPLRQWWKRRWDLSCQLVVKFEQSSDVLQEQGIISLTRPNWVSIRLEGITEEKERAITTHHPWKPSDPRAELCYCACCDSNFLCCWYRERFSY